MSKSEKLLYGATIWIVGYYSFAFLAKISTPGMVEVISGLFSILFFVGAPLITAAWMAGELDDVDKGRYK